MSNIAKWNSRAPENVGDLICAREHDSKSAAIYAANSRLRSVNRKASDSMERASLDPRQFCRTETRINTSLVTK